jgi:hypothetical protein
MKPNDSPARAHLRKAISEHKAACAQADNARAAADRAFNIVDELQTKLAKLEAATAKAETAATASAAQAIKALTTCGTTLDLTASDHLIKARRERDQTAEQLVAARSAHSHLVSELTEFEQAAQKVHRLVSAAAVALIVQDIEVQSASLAALWCDIWARYDMLLGFSGHWTPGGKPRLPHGTLKLIQTIAAKDARQLIGGTNPAVKAYRDQAEAWYKALLTNPDAVCNGESGDKRKAA